MNFPEYNGRTIYQIGDIVRSGSRLYINVENGEFLGCWDYYKPPTITKNGNILQVGEL